MSRDLSHEFYNRTKKEIIFPDVDLEGVDHQNKLEKLKKTRMRNMNMITTKQKISTM